MLGGKPNRAVTATKRAVILGPIGLPATEAVEPGVATTDGKPRDASNDCATRMAADEPPATEVFWSLTLYDLSNGFFIPNDHKKYSVGEYAGMKLDENGGACHVGGDDRRRPGDGQHRAEGRL